MIDLKSLIVKKKNNNPGSFIFKIAPVLKSGGDTRAPMKRKK